MGNMASQRDKKRGQVECVVRVSPEVVDAGAEATLQAEVSCVPACDLRGHCISIQDQTGADIGTVELSTFDGRANESGGFIVKAPIQAGTYAWSAMCPPLVKEGIAYVEVSTPIHFTVKPHTTSVVVWDIPSAVVIGERFRTKIGFKCSSECQLTNRAFGIYDHNGTRIADGSLSGDRWPGTGLYSAEVELQAPPEEGLYTWSASCPGSDAEIPHGEGSIGFGVRVVGRPAYLVMVEAIDKVTGTPLSGARVVMHPYRAITDERGRAELRVAQGLYKLFVTQSRYLTFDLSVDVTADVTARAELELEPVTERN
jgi:hypothetical protein